MAFETMGGILGPNQGARKEKEKKRKREDPQFRGEEEKRKKKEEGRGRDGINEPVDRRPEIVRSGVSIRPVFLLSSISFPSSFDFHDL